MPNDDELPKPDNLPAALPEKPTRIGKPGKPLAPPLPPLPEPDTKPLAAESTPAKTAQTPPTDEPKRGPGRPPRTVTGPSELIPGHRARVARVHANTAAWLPVARWSVRSAETLGRLFVERRVLAKAETPEQAARLQQAIRTFPTLENIPVTWDGKETNCHELEAQNAAVIAAYALPFTPDDPLFGIVLRHAAVSMAVEKALEKHLREQGLIKSTEPES